MLYLLQPHLQTLMLAWFFQRRFIKGMMLTQISGPLFVVQLVHMLHTITCWIAMFPRSTCYKTRTIWLRYSGCYHCLLSFRINSTGLAIFLFASVVPFCYLCFNNIAWQNSCRHLTKKCYLIPFLFLHSEEVFAPYFCILATKPATNNHK